jgi:hypothetical protein
MFIKNKNKNGGISRRLQLVLILQTDKSSVGQSICHEEQHRN